MTTKQPRAKDDLFTYESEHKLRLENEAWLIQKCKEELAARDQEILKILEGCKKHCPNCEGDPEEWSGDECNKEWNGALDTAIGALVEETDVK